MYELLLILICLLVPAALIIGGIIFFVRLSSHGKSQPVEFTQSSLLKAFQKQLRAWVTSGKLAEANAAAVLTLIDAELAALQPTPEAAAPAVTAQPVIAAAQPVIAAAQPSAVPIATPADAIPPMPPALSLAERLWSGVLALRARQMLLFLGAFLLVVSSFVLVLFNWEIIPPLVQVSLLAGVCAALWAAGEGLERRWSLPSAAAGLRAVSGVLWPFVAFIGARLLFGGVHGPWLAAALLSLPLYTLAARRLHQPLFVLSGCVAGLNAALAAAGYLSWQALPAAAVLACLGYLILAQRIVRFDQAMSKRVWWFSQVSVPVALLVAVALGFGGLLTNGAFSLTLWIVFGFYALATWQENRRVWAWVAALVGPLATIASANTLLPGRSVLFAAALIGLSALYLLAEALLRRVNRPVLADVPGRLARLLGPAILVLVMLLSVAGPFDNVRNDIAMVLWIGLGFALLLVRIEPHVEWGLLAALALPAALTATLATFGTLPPRTTELTWLLIAVVYAPLARRLRGSKRERLRYGPLVIAQVLALLVLVGANFGPEPAWQEVALTWGVFGFLLLELALERRAVWLYPLLVLAPFAWLRTATFFDWGVVPYVAQVSLFTLAYLAYAISTERRNRWFALPGYLVGTLLGVFATFLALGEGFDTLRWALPGLVAACALIVVASHRTLLAWLRPVDRELVAAASLGGFAALLSIWLWAMLALPMTDQAWRAVALLPLASIAFAAAHWWPGKLRPSYPLVLRTVACVLAVIYAGLTLGNRDAVVIGAALFAATWWFQTALQRNLVWAALALSSSVGAAVLALDRFAASEAQWLLVAAAFVALYTLGAWRVQRGAWRCLVGPGLIIGSAVGVGALAFVIQQLNFGAPITLAQISVVLAFAALAAAHSVLWRRWLLGYLAGPLLVLGTLMLFASGLVVPWMPQFADYAYILCGLTLMLVAIGESLRRRVVRYALPYEQLGYVLLLAVPWLASDTPMRATLCWAFIALALGYATLRYNLRWALLGALLAADVALLAGASWAFPGGDASGAARLFVLAAWAQGGLAMAIGRARAKLVLPAYVATVTSGVAALLFAVAVGWLDASRGYLILAQVALALAALAAVVATFERAKPATWLTLGLLVLGLAYTHLQLGYSLAWSASYGVFEMLLVYALGWALERLALRPGWFQRLAIWHLPLDTGALLLGFGLAAVAALNSINQPTLFTLTGSMVLLAMLLTTAAVRRRSFGLAYGAGAALLIALLSQLFDLGQRQPEWFVLPAGIYLLVLADGLRRFQGRRQLARLIESGGLLLILGTAATRAVQGEGGKTFLLTLALCGESLLALAYGIVRRRQVPFVGGAAAFIFGVVWLAVDPLQSTNTWVILGALGLGLVGLYVLLERRQEQLLRTGKLWIARFNAWE